MSILYAKHRPPIGGVLTNKPIIIMDKNIIEKIQNRYERRDKAINFIRVGQEKRDELDPIKNKDEIAHINHMIDVATFQIICELDELLMQVEVQL